MDVHVPCKARQWIQGRQLTGAPASQIRGGPTPSLGSPKSIKVSERYLG